MFSIQAICKNWAKLRNEQDLKARRRCTGQLFQEQETILQTCPAWKETIVPCCLELLRSTTLKSTRNQWNHKGHICENINVLVSNPFFLDLSLEGVGWYSKLWYQFLSFDISFLKSVDDSIGFLFTRSLSCYTVCYAEKQSPKIPNSCPTFRMTPPWI